LLQTRYENDLELSGRTIYGRVGRKKEMRSCLSNLDPLQNTPTLAKLHPKMITASTSRASVSRVRSSQKNLPTIIGTSVPTPPKFLPYRYMYTKSTGVPPLSQTPERRDLRSRRQIKQTTIDRSSSTIIFNFFFWWPPRHIWPDSARLPGNSARRLFRGSP
jgi:hypothetical protein